MASLPVESLVKLVDLTSCSGPSDAKVVIVPLPKNTVGMIFGQMIAEWRQRFSVYILSTNLMPVNTQVIFDATSNGSRFDITRVNPPSAQQPDPNIFSVGPFSDDRYIAVHCSHQKPGSSSYSQSDPRQSCHVFKIGGKSAMSVTMVNAEDGGDTDYHDTVVGVAVCNMDK